MPSNREVFTWLALFTVLNVVVIDWLAPRMRPEEFFFRTDAAWSRWASEVASPGEQHDSWGAMLRAQQYVMNAGGSGLYEQVFFEEDVKFQYPPTSLLVLEILGIDPSEPPEEQYRRLNRISWFAVPATLLAALALFALAWRRYLGAGDPYSWACAALVMVLSASFFPIVDAYRLGQIQVWLNAGTAVAFLCWALNRKVLAGFVVGLLCLVKPQYGIIYLWALVGSRKRFSVGATISGTAGLAGSVALFGWRNHLEYFSVASFLSRRGETYFPNQSVNGLLNRLVSQDPSEIMRFTDQFPPFHPAVYAGSTIAAVVLVGGCLYSARNRGLRFPEAALAIPVLTATLASPIAWEHHYGTLLPILALAAPWAVARWESSRGWLLLLASVYLLTAHPFLMRGWTGGYEIFDALAGTPLNILFSYMFAGGVILLALMYCAQHGTRLLPEYPSAQRRKQSE